MSGIREEGELEEQLDKLVPFEDLFLSRKEHIKTALSQISKTDFQLTQNQIIHQIEIALSGKIGEEDVEELESAVIGFLRLIVRWEGATADMLNERDASDEFVDFVLNMIINYGHDFQRLSYRQAQGRNWWSDIETDIIISDQIPKTTHRITIDQSREVEVDSAPQSDWLLARHFLLKLTEVVNGLEGQEGQVVDLDEFNRIRQLVYNFEDKFEAIEGVELPSREELLTENVEQKNSEEHNND